MGREGNLHIKTQRYYIGYLFYRILSDTLNVMQQVMQQLYGITPRLLKLK